MKTCNRLPWLFLLLASSLFQPTRAAEPVDPKTPALQLGIETPKNTFKSSEEVSFTVVFHNRGASHLLLNGGEMLGNGSQLWSSLALELKSETGPPIPIILGWGVPGVAGRIYFLGLPLRAGANYQLPVKPGDYLIGAGERLKPGKYELRCIFQGRQSQFRDSTQLPACWEGELKSNVLRFVVLGD